MLDGFVSVLKADAAHPPLSLKPVPASELVHHTNRSARVESPVRRVARLERCHRERRADIVAIKTQAEVRRPVVLHSQAHPAGKRLAGRNAHAAGVNSSQKPMNHDAERALQRSEEHTSELQSLT